MLQQKIFDSRGGWAITPLALLQNRPDTVFPSSERVVSFGQNAVAWKDSFDPLWITCFFFFKG
ncbi:hypothetical protein CH359_12835 [Leptospira meyeri]|nr:hypothetical protein CH359_12835 [Leptospira meyeri]PJZ95836.1 hypothetical protein CH358_15960 [Leptospira meyeri]PKA13236.1 hypothetical protein CH372_05180 [Leptospira meyeri]PKA25246.1 hypothetical protein CH381_16430 [Leptospira sp. mixed culture ATI2-C-A1]